MIFWSMIAIIRYIPFNKKENECQLLEQAELTGSTVRGRNKKEK